MTAGTDWHSTCVSLDLKFNNVTKEWKLPDGRLFLTQFQVEVCHVDNISKLVRSRKRELGI